MLRAKKYALGCLIAGLALAMAAPAYVALAVPDRAGYLLHPALFLLQPVPYVLCGALWLPRRDPAAATTALVLAVVLLLSTVIAYVPMMWTPAARGGDMMGIMYVALSAAMTVAVLVGSAVAFLVIWLRRHRNRA